MLGRISNFVAAFNELLRQPGAVQKYYRALTMAPPPTGATHCNCNLQVQHGCHSKSVQSMLSLGNLACSEVWQRDAGPNFSCELCAGTLVHFVTVGKRVKGLPAHTAVHSAAIPGSQRCELDILSVRQVQLGLSATALGWPSSAYESTILLKSGRTHQVTCGSLATKLCTCCGKSLGISHDAIHELPKHL